MGTVIVLLILRTGSLLKNGFEQIYMLYSPSVYEVADVFETYTYRVGIMEGRFSFATAVGLFTSVVGFILIMSTNKLSKKIQGGGLW
jgi:putative aldouronate transport system permease protein